MAITLLALDLTVPRPGHGELLTQLGDHWPQFAAYVVSFFTIGIIWVNHHARVSLIVVVDRTLLFLNLVLLLFVVLIPFATATMATYLTSGSEESHIAMAVYAVVLEGMALSFTAMFEWSLGEGRTQVAVPARSAPQRARCARRSARSSTQPSSPSRSSARRWRWRSRGSPPSTTSSRRCPMHGVEAEVEELTSGPL